MDHELTCNVYKKLAFINTCICVAHDMSIRLPVKVVEEIIDKNDTLTDEWKSFYYNETSQKMGFMDTNIREEFLDEMSMYFINMNHPRFGDSQEYKEMWYDQLYKETARLGYSDTL